MTNVHIPRLRAGGAGRERILQLDRFGGRAELRVQPADGCTAQAQRRLERAAALLESIDETLSRFNPRSELVRLNADPRTHVPASPLMLRFAEAVGWAGRRSAGLVDATCLAAVERAGYRHHLVVPDFLPIDPSGGHERLDLGDLDAALFDLVATAPSHQRPEAGTHRPGGWLDPKFRSTWSETSGQTSPEGAWRAVLAGPDYVDRPTGVRLDSGGIGKGLAADLAADLLRGAPSWMVDCGGDLRIGGTARVPRAVDVRDPVDPSQVIHRLHVTRGAVATSGVTRRSWDQDGIRSHHLIDPRTGQPADTGLLQVTALAPTALEAEVLAKTALLHGVERAHDQLTHGGIVVAQNGSVTVVPPPRVEQTRRRTREDRAAFHLPGRAPVTRQIRRP